MPWTDNVLRFWFEELSPADWFAARPEVDDAIWDRFGDLRQEMKAAPPDPAALDGLDHVAAVIVFDQFSRDMFRRSPEAFATDGLALGLARHAVDNNLDLALQPHEQQFLYMPFLHAEDVETQRQSIALFAKIGTPGVLEFAEKHKDVIDRFGRFPTRNKALKRVSTEAELEFLNAKT